MISKKQKIWDATRYEKMVRVAFSLGKCQWKISRFPFYQTHGPLMKNNGG